MKFFTNASFKGRLALNKQWTGGEYPADPELGEFAFVDGVLWTYVLINSTETWYPMTNKAEHFVHEQVAASSEWTIEHGLETKNLAYFVYDDADVSQFANITFVDDNNVTINLSEPTAGRAIFFASTNSYASGEARIVYVDKYAEKRLDLGDVSGDVTISLDAGLVHTLTVTGDTNISFTGWATGERSSGVTVVFQNAGNHTVTFTDTMQWTDATAPTFTLDGKDRIVFVSDDGGTTVEGYVSGLGIG